MYNLLKTALDGVISKVYDGEPLGRNRRRRTGSLVDNILEEEILFCKNNVCVHNNILHQGDIHTPGYLNLKKVYKADAEIADLILTWVPNPLLTVGALEGADLAFDFDADSNGDVNVIEGSPNKTSSGSCNDDSNLPPEPNPEECVISTVSCGSELLTGDSSQPAQAEPTIFDEQETTVSVDPCVPTKISSANTSLSLPLSPSRLKPFETPFGEVFSVNLFDMKAVKLFYANKGVDSGQFVISNHENQYKVFHFHNTGMGKLVDIFDAWKGCSLDCDLVVCDAGQRVYHVICESRTSSDRGHGLHPEEGRYAAMTLSLWNACINPLGQIEDVNNLRKHVFFGGLSQEVRADAWKFLLYLYPMHSTRAERDQILREKAMEYQVLHNQRLGLHGEAYEKFWRSVQFTVDKDVVRTDRSNPYFAGQDNPNVQKMRNILLNYAIYNPTMGYTQGMSDLVAPLLATIDDEVESFWCFVGLMDFSLFATTPTDHSMDSSLGFLRELLRILVPEFYIHCLCQDYELALLFCHRWLVLCFKREFITPEVLRIWESCWSRYQTDYFHIFVCAAICSLYGDACIQKKMQDVDMLQYFTDMAMKFDGSAVLVEARSLLFKFRQLHRVPCTLRGLLSGPGVWDGGIAPEIECARHRRSCCGEASKASEENFQTEFQEMLNVMEEIEKEKESVDRYAADTFRENLQTIVDVTVGKVLSDADVCTNKKQMDESTSEAGHYTTTFSEEASNEACHYTTTFSEEASNDCRRDEERAPSKKLDNLCPLSGPASVEASALAEEPTDSHEPEAVLTAAHPFLASLNAKHLVETEEVVGGSQSYGIRSYSVEQRPETPPHD